MTRISVTEELLRIMLKYLELRNRLSLWVHLHKTLNKYDKHLSQTTPNAGLTLWTYNQEVASLTPNWVAIKWLLPGTGDCLWTGKSYRYITNHPGQLSLPSLCGRQIKYRPTWLGLRQGTLACQADRKHCGIPCGRWLSVALRWVL